MLQRDTASFPYDHGHDQKDDVMSNCPFAVNETENNETICEEYSKQDFQHDSNFFDPTDQSTENMLLIKSPRKKQISRQKIRWQSKTYLLSDRSQSGD